MSQPSSSGTINPPIKEASLLLLLAAVQFTHIMDFMVIMPLGPQLMRTFQIDPAQFSFLVAIYTFAAGISGIIGTLFIDRYDRRPTLLFCYSGFIIGTLACALAPNYEALLAARAISGAFGGLAGSIVLTIIGDVIPPERRGRAIGLIMTSFSLASIFGVPIGLWLAATWTWHAPFHSIVFMGAIVTFFIAKSLPSMNAHLRDSQSEMHQIFGNLKALLISRNSLMALGFMSLCVFGHFIIIPFISPSLTTNAGLAENRIFLFYLFGGIASFFTSPFIGRLTDRYGKNALYIWTILLGSIPVYLVSSIGQSSMTYIMIITILYFSLAGGRFIPAQAIVTAAVPSQMRGSFLSLNNSVRDFGAGLASIIGGQIVVEDASGHLLNMPILGVISIVVSILSIGFIRQIRAVS